MRRPRWAPAVHPGEAEVEDLDPAVGGHEQVLRFEVAVDDASSSGRREAVGHRGADARNLLPRQAGRLDVWRRLSPSSSSVTA